MILANRPLLLTDEDSRKPVALPIDHFSVR